MAPARGFEVRTCLAYEDGNEALGFNARVGVHTAAWHPPGESHLRPSKRGMRLMNH